MQHRTAVFIILLHRPHRVESVTRGFHKRTKLAILALMPTLYYDTFVVFFFLYLYHMILENIRLDVSWY